MLEKTAEQIEAERREQHRLKVLRGEHLSYWSYSTYKQCPAKFRYTVVERREGPKQDLRNAYEGAVLHAAIENWYKEQVFTRPRFFELMEQARKEIIANNSIAWHSSGDEAAANRNLGDQAASFLKKVVQYRLLAKKTEVEKTLEVQVGDLTIRGRVDLTLFDANGDIRVYDWKGVKTKNYISKEQLLTYDLFIRANYGVAPAKVGFIFTRLEGADVYTFKPEETAELVADYQAVAEKVKRGIFLGVVGRHCEWCEAKDICPFYLSKNRNNRLWQEVKALKPGEVNL